MSNVFAAESAAAAQRWELPLLQHFDLPVTPPHTAQHLDELEKAAYEDGFARGHADGQAQGYGDGAQRVREHGERLREVFDHLARPLRELDTDVERMLVALAIEVGRRLAQTALTQDPALVAGIIHEALGALTQPARDARIHLHPADAEIVKDTLNLTAEIGAWRLVPDSELRRGDCRVITDSAQVDARLDTREAGIAQALLGERG